MCVILVYDIGEKRMVKLNNSPLGVRGLYVCNIGEKRMVKLNNSPLGGVGGYMYVILVKSEW